MSTAVRAVLSITILVATFPTTAINRGHCLSRRLNSAGSAYGLVALGGRHAGPTM
jgi:hypothetical protein